LYRHWANTLLILLSYHLQNVRLHSIDLIIYCLQQNGIFFLLKDFRITRRLSVFRLLVGAVLSCAVCHIHVWLCGGFDRSLLSPDALYLKYSKGAGNAWACCMTESECSRSSSHTYSDKQIVSGTGGQRAFHFCTYYTSLSLSTLKVFQWKEEWRGVRQGSGWVFVMSFVQEAFSGPDLVGGFEQAQRSSRSRCPGRWKVNTVAVGSQQKFSWNAYRSIYL